MNKCINELIFHIQMSQLCTIIIYYLCDTHTHITHHRTRVGHPSPHKYAFKSGILIETNEKKKKLLERSYRVENSMSVFDYMYGKKWSEQKNK